MAKPDRSQWCQDRNLVVGGGGVLILNPRSHTVRACHFTKLQNIQSCFCPLPGPLAGLPYRDSDGMIQETWVRSLGREDSPGGWHATHSSLMPGESHGQRSLAGLQSMGSQRDGQRHDWARGPWWPSPPISFLVSSLFRRNWARPWPSVFNDSTAWDICVVRDGSCTLLEGRHPPPRACLKWSQPASMQITHQSCRHPGKHGWNRQWPPGTPLGSHCDERMLDFCRSRLHASAQSHVVLPKT